MSCKHHRQCRLNGKLLDVTGQRELQPKQSGDQLSAVRGKLYAAPHKITKQWPTIRLALKSSSFRELQSRLKCLSWQENNSQRLVVSKAFRMCTS